MSLLLSALVVLVAGGLLAVATSRYPRLSGGFGCGGAVFGSALALLPALAVLRGGAPLSWRGSWAVPGGEFVLALDPLAAAFLLPAALLALLGAIYARGYLHDHPRPAALGGHWFFYNLLVAALLVVFTAAHALLFLAAWELMALGSFFLVAFEHHRPEVRQAAWLYLAIAHVALLLLFAFFTIAGAQCGGLTFADLPRLARLTPLGGAALFALAALAFAIKAGLFPFHVWLPDAHPAAPSHVSALMSGVVVKTGIYGLLRLSGFFPALAPEIGLVLMLLGAAGALYGIALAIMQQDIKRALAYSTVENIGIVVMALGLFLYADRSGQPALAAVALAGALLHCWNHTLFKGLLFLGAGSLLHATGSRELNRMGGLLRRMPATGVLLIGGSLAIAALPPGNGLISEGLIYLGLLTAGIQTDGGGGVVPLLLVGVLALVGALALIAFTRLVGIVLLGEPRSAAAAQAHESGPLLLVPMALLLSGCLAIGLFPQLALGLLAAPLTQLVPDAPRLLAPAVASVTGFGLWGGVLLLILGAFALLLRLWVRLRPPASAATWGCAYPAPTPRMAYSGDSYAELTRSHLLPALLVAPAEATPVRGLFPAASRLGLRQFDPFLARLYLPLVEALAVRCVRLRWLQQGRLQVYLLYAFLTCTVLMVWIVLADRGWGGG